MLLLTLAFFMAIIYRSGGNLKPVDEEVSTQLKEYLTTGVVNFEENRVTIAVVVYDEGLTSPIVSFFIRRKLRYATVVANAALKFPGAHVERMKNIFCFVETFSNIKEILELIKSEPCYQFDGRFRFIISTPVTDRAWLNDTLAYIWSWNVLNFVVVYEIYGRVEIVGYNPFRKHIINCTNIYHRKNVFTDKVANLWGYRLTAAMFWDNPRHRMIKGVLWGKDVNLFKEFARHINATPIIRMLGTFPEVINAVDSKSANLTFNKRFADANKKIIRNGEPVEFGYVSVLVPTSGSKPQYLYLFEIFNSYLLFSILTTLILVIGFTYCFKQYLLGESITIIVQILLNVSWQQFAKTRLPLSFLLMSWVIFSMLLATTFNSKLLSFLVTPRYFRGITTLEELARSKLPVGCAFKNSPLFDDNKMFNHQLVEATNDEAMYNNNKDKAYIMSSSYAEIIQRKRDKFNRHIYKKLKQSFSAGLNVYLFEENSPFKAKFRTVLLLFRKYGIGNFGMDYLPNDVVVENNNVPLSVPHLQSAFYIVCFGLLLSLVAFGAEIAYHQMLKRRS